MRSVTVYYHENEPAEIHLNEKIAIAGIGTATRKAQLVVAEHLDAADKRAVVALTKRILAAAERKATATAEAAPPE
jgi:hypothetical protein